MYYVEASSNLCLLDNHLCLTIFCPTVHQIGSDSEVLRLYQVWSLHHRFSWEGLSRYSRCWQQRAQLSRQIAQWSDERGQLQSHTHEMLAGHLIRKFDRKKKIFFTIMQTSLQFCIQKGPLLMYEASRLLMMVNIAIFFWPTWAKSAWGTFWPHAKLLMKWIPFEITWFSWTMVNATMHLANHTKNCHISHKSLSFSSSWVHS